MGKPESTNEYVQVTLPIIIIILGLFGNIFSGIVLLRKNFRHRSISIYLLAISVLDSIFLVSSSPLDWAIRVLFGFDYQSLSGAGCGASLYIINASRAMSAWVLVVLTVERMLVMAIPHLARQFISWKRALISISVVIIIVGAVYSYCLFVFDLYPYGKMCYWEIEVETKKLNIVLSVFDFLFYVVIPSTIMATCNCSLVFFLYYSREVRERGEADHRNIAVTVLSINTAFILLTAPLGIRNIVYISGVKMEGPAFLYTVLYSLDLLNHSMNCILYSFTGPAFRNEVRSMFSCCCRKNKDRPSQERRAANT